MVIKYFLSFDKGCSHVVIPELNGREIVESPEWVYVDDEVLDIMHFCYNASFEPYDSDVFTTIWIQKEGGDDQCVKSTAYYEQLTREEADCIITEIIETTLGLEGFELETDSEDFIDENEYFDDEDYDDEDEDEYDEDEDYDEDE